MQDQPTRRGLGDAAVQRAVLSLVLDAHPNPLTIPALATQIDQGDAVERAVCELVGVGLLTCGGISIRPNGCRASLRAIGPAVRIDIAAHFGDNLARARKRAGLSQEELSVCASLHRTEISQLERGLRLARIDTLIKLAASLEINAAELLDGLGWKPGGMVHGRFRVSEGDGP